MTLQTPDNTNSQGETAPLRLAVETLFPKQRLRQFLEDIKLFETFLLENGTQLSQTIHENLNDLGTSTISISQAQLKQAKPIQTKFGLIDKDQNKQLYLKTPTNETIYLAPIPNQEFKSMGDNYPHGTGNPWILESTLRIVAHHFPEFFSLLKTHMVKFFERFEELDFIDYRISMNNIDFQLTNQKYTLEIDTFIEYFQSFISIIQSTSLTEEDRQELNNLINSDAKNIQTVDKETTITSSYIHIFPKNQTLRRQTLSIINQIIEEYNAIDIGDLVRNVLTTFLDILYFFSITTESSEDKDGNNNINTHLEP